MKIIKRVLLLILIIFFVIIVFLIFATVTDYKPNKSELLCAHLKPDTIIIGEPLSALIWNIGYCGLDKQMDFFYDGGSKVVTPYSQYKTNELEILRLLEQADSIDYIMLQEVDVNSKRSYNSNQFQKFDSILINHKSNSFAYNYKVHYVPMPLNCPMGKTNSGLATFTKNQFSSSSRISFPGNYSWPTSIFMLDRCFMVNRFPTNNKKQLLVINTHNSAYDDGTLKKSQMNFLKEFINEEFIKGNYIIIGGDWNQNPPNYLQKNASKEWAPTSINTDFMPAEWSWISDTTVSTNRYLNSEYIEGVTSTTVLDFFLISPNVKACFVITINYNFDHSDHNPVMIKFTLM